MNGFRPRVAERWSIVRLAPRAGRGLVLLLAVVNVALGVLPVVFVIATSVVLGHVPAAVQDGLGSAAWSSLVAVFVLAAAAFVGQQVVAPVETMLRDRVVRRIDGEVFRQLMAASMATPGVSRLEDQRVLDDLRTAARELEFGYQSPGQAVPGLFALIARYTQLVGYAVVVGVAFSWLAAVGLVTGVLLFRYGQRGGLRKYAKVRFDLANPMRKVDYLRRLAIDPTAGKEIRVFGLVEWLRDALREAYLNLLRPVWAERRRVYLWPFVWFTLWGWLVAAGVFAGLGATATITGGSTLTAFVMVVQATLGALRLSEFYPEADPQNAVGMHAYEAVRRFERRVAGATDPVAAGDGAPEGTRDGAEVPAPAREIRFEGVSFRYPGTDRLILDNLDLSLPVGRCTALVGLNGAGKTTLVKLLARLYEPTGGVIRLDGVDIRSYPVAQWRTRLGIIFQSFARYEMSIADNIAMGAAANAADRDGIRSAAEAVGLGELLAGLPAGLDTPLAQHITGGVELSGGQWQRVALARALFALRHGSPIVVLDEPTASLDVRAEAKFFDEFADLTQGATTLLISHRFSSVRRADRIVVLEGGRVSEDGSHTELMALGGRYAQLFRLQADRFTAAQVQA